MISAPPKLENFLNGHKLQAGLSYTTIMADVDFETYSPAGFIWCDETKKYHPPHGSDKKGLLVIGIARYVEHPEAEILCMAYDLKDGKGKRQWVPELPFPEDLKKFILHGGILEAWNSSFEWWVWQKIGIPKYNFPDISIQQFRDAAAKARAFCLPGSLENAGNVLNIKNKKDKDGKRLLDKFSIPRNPTSKDPRHRIRTIESPKDAQKLLQYNIRDIEAEAELSSLIPDLNNFELKFWQACEIINYRGVQIDVKNVKNCIAIIEQAYHKYNLELCEITDGKVESATKLHDLKKWLRSNGIFTSSLNAESTAELLKNPLLSPPVRRALEIRSIIGSAAVKKVYAMLNTASSKERLHGLFVYHSARTGRAAGVSAQPQNLPNGGMTVNCCTKCAKHSANPNACGYCGHPTVDLHAEWGYAAVRDALESIETQSLECVEFMWGDAVEAVSGCLRGLFISKSGYNLISSDYSSIEAVVLAMLASEQWRIDVFETHGKIYEMSASKITGMSFDEYELYKSTSGKHHPDRKLGKVAELASGYGGWLGAWKQFGADQFLSDDKIKESILNWRKASPYIVELWGGQQRGWDTNTKYFGLEGMAVLAILNPGNTFKYGDISYLMKQDTLFCILPSGRNITYHRPRLTASTRRAGTLSISFEGWNTNPKNGAIGWVRLETFGGRLTENVVQAVARDILAYAIVNLEKSGYPVVLHIHDEIVCEIPEDFGSVEEFENIMMQLPNWAHGWPIKAKGGWRDKRYRK